MPHVWNSQEFEWNGNGLCLLGRKAPVVTIVNDPQYPSMWRVQRPDGSLSDMVNLTRARDAARLLAARVMNERAKDAVASDR